MLRLTVNLHDALQALQYEHTIRVLRADAVCINQVDLEEKGHQVALIGSIYRDAQKVVVWLGCRKVARGKIAIVLNDLIEAFENLGDTFEAVFPIERAMTRLWALGFLQQPWYAFQFSCSSPSLTQQSEFVFRVNIYIWSTPLLTPGS
jgi:uncharacterized membrane protein